MNQNKRVLVFREFVYEEENVNKTANVIKWKCMNPKCPAHILMNNFQEILKESTYHNHKNTVMWSDNKIKFKMSGTNS